MPYVSRADVRLYYEDAGSGPVVLLHTGGGGDGRMRARGCQNHTRWIERG